jgi:two-component system cell cycle sensor histidine kinase PleC
MQNKHIIRFLFLNVFIIVIANILLYRYFIMESIIIREGSHNDKFLVEAYRDTVWHLFPGVIKKLSTERDEKLFFSEEFINFTKATSNFFKYKECIKIQILDNKEQEIFASNNLKVDHNSDNNIGIYDRIMNKLDHLIFSDLVENGLFIPNASIENIEDQNNITTNNTTIIKEYFPLINNENRVESIVLIYRDITKLWREIRSLELKVCFTFFIFFIILFIILFYNTRYAQNIINKQFQANKLLEEAKRKAENESSAKTQFLANVSHELRTPLNSIIGFSEIILYDRDNKETNPRHMDYVQDIHNSGQHLLSVINDILDYSKVTAKKLNVELIEVNLNKIVTSSMRFMEPKVKAAKVSMIQDITNAQIIIKADPKRLKQALLNILSNAVKFTPANGNITVSITKIPKKKRVNIRIQDTGIGISKENLPKALISFEQIDNKKNRRYEGTGLGLPLTKKLVELMKGTFDITSVLGQGTIVTLSFKYEEE